MLHISCHSWNHSWATTHLLQALQPYLSLLLLYVYSLCLRWLLFDVSLLFPIDNLHVDILPGVSTVRGSVSVSGGQLLLFKTTFFFITVVVGLLLITIGSLLFALETFSTGATPSKVVADGSIYMAVLAITIIMQVAIIFPGLLLLQPSRWYHIMTSLHKLIALELQAVECDSSREACYYASPTLQRYFYLQ